MRYSSDVLSLLHRPLESIAAADLQSLVDIGVRESLYIEYKTEVFDKRDKDKRLQFLGSVSGFANASGGDLLIGVEAKNAIPTDLPGLDSGMVDGEILRIKQVLGSAIQPFLRVQFHSVALANGRTVIIIRVPQSWNPPHGISAVNRPKPAFPHARQLPGGGGILFQLRFRLGGEGSAGDFDLGKVNPGQSPHGHDSVYLTFGGAEQLRSRLGRC